MKDPSLTERTRGFTLVELLVVVAIIAIMAAISLPFIVGYLRHYKIRGASQEVAKEIQAARGKAISKNVNFGVVFLDGRPPRPIAGSSRTTRTRADGMADARGSLAGPHGHLAELTPASAARAVPSAMASCSARPAPASAARG